MHEAWTHELETWHEFYLLVGTAGVTLTGLLFVVVSLGPRVVADHQATGVRAFISPNAVYFTTALVVSALLMVPSLPAMAIGALLCLGRSLRWFIWRTPRFINDGGATSFHFWTGFGLLACR
jgi:hypothetical protein